MERKKNFTDFKGRLDCRESPGVCSVRLFKNWEMLIKKLGLKPPWNKASAHVRPEALLVEDQKLRQVWLPSGQPEG
jgi:hypothetical protein